jgi:hypothetical protein
VTQIYIKESAYLHLKFDDDYEDRVAGNDGIPHFNSAYSSGVDFIEGMENRAIDLSGSSSDNEYVELFSQFIITTWIR